jgi:hypothetical protein
MATSVSLPQHKEAAVLRPPRTLGFTSLVGITFFCVAGGAYGLEDAVGAAGPAWALLAILVVPWLWSLPMALMTAELTAAMPEDGGFVVWVERAFGRFWAFQEGWWSWLCSFADNALYPVMFAEYLRFWFPGMTSVQFWLVCLTMIAVVACLNVRVQGEVIKDARSSSPSPAPSPPWKERGSSVRRPPTKGMLPPPRVRRGSLRVGGREHL